METLEVTQGELGDGQDALGASLDYSLSNCELTTCRFVIAGLHTSGPPLTSIDVTLSAGGPSLRSSSPTSPTTTLHSTAAGVSGMIDEPAEPTSVDAPAGIPPLTVVDKLEADALLQ